MFGGGGAIGYLTTKLGGGYNGKYPKIARAPGGHKRFMLTKLGGGGKTE